MRGLIPVTNARSALGVEGLSRGQISETQAWAWDDAAPRLHLMHPCAVDRHARADEAWMVHQPVADFLTMRCADLIAPERNRREMVATLHSSLCQ